MKIVLSFVVFCLVAFITVGIFRFFHISDLITGMWAATLGRFATDSIDEVYP